MSRSRWGRGMTLLEVLVTLLIVALASSLVLQALQQLARVERALEGGQLGAQSSAVNLRREWLRSLLAGALPEQVNAPLQFQGSSEALDFRSAQQADGFGAGYTRWRLSVQSDPDVAGGQLLQLQDLDRADAAPMILLRWQGEPGALRYLDDEGAWHMAWPHAAAATESVAGIKRPPRLVRLELGAEAGGVLLMPVVSREPPRARLADWVDG